MKSFTVVLGAALMIGCGTETPLVPSYDEEVVEEVPVTPNEEIIVTTTDDEVWVVVVPPVVETDAGTPDVVEPDAGVETPVADAGTPDNGPVSNGCNNGQGKKKGLLKHGRCD